MHRHFLFKTGLIPEPQSETPRVKRETHSPDLLEVATNPKDSDWESPFKDPACPISPVSDTSALRVWRVSPRTRVEAGEVHFHAYSVPFHGLLWHLHPGCSIPHSELIL